MQKKFLFIVDEFPYPPRNGITIPTFNFISKFSSIAEVYLIYLKCKHTELEKENLEKLKEYVKEIWVIEMIEKSKYNRIKEEIFLQNPFFIKWKYSLNRIDKYLHSYDFDVIWISPFTFIDIIDRLKKIVKSDTIFIAGINDSFSKMMRNSINNSIWKNLEFEDRLIHLLKWLRSFYLTKIEYNILQKYDLILVQTNVELEWLSKISKNKIYHKIFVCPNGVNDKLFSRKITFNNEDLLFFGDLRGLYSNSIIWFLNNVWPKLALRNPKIRFHIVGKNISNALLKKVSIDKNISYDEYIPNILDIFEKKFITIAPVFKNFGIINKVIESMAAGVPVVGTKGCFNGIPEFRDSLHGITAENPEFMVNKIIELQRSKQLYFQIANSARALIKKNFSWQDRVFQLNNRIAMLLKDSGSG
jgi:glycosyltransferase involved in cell wall biosynthesis